MAATKTRSRGREPMGELTINVPVRWIQFIEDYFAVTDTNRDAEMKGWVKAILLTFIDDLDAKELIRLVEKHKLTDVYEIPQGVRDQAAAVAKPTAVVPPVSEKQIDRAIDFLMKKPEFLVDFLANGKDAVIRGMKTLSLAELSELASMGAPA